MLFQEETFLLFYLPAQFFFCRHIGHIFGCKQLFTTVKNRIFCHHLISLGAKQYAYGRIVVFIFTRSSYIRTYISIVPIRMCQRMCFQFKQHITLELDVIEYEVNVKSPVSVEICFCLSTKANPRPNSMINCCRWSIKACSNWLSSYLLSLRKPKNSATTGLFIYSMDHWLQYRERVTPILPLHKPYGDHSIVYRCCG